MVSATISDLVVPLPEIVNGRDEPLTVRRTYVPKTVELPVTVSLQQAAVAAASRTISNLRIIKYYRSMLLVQAEDPWGLRNEDPCGLRTQDPYGLRTQDPYELRIQDPYELRIQDPCGLRTKSHR